MGFFGYQNGWQPDGGGALATLPAEVTSERAPALNLEGGFYATSICLEFHKNVSPGAVVRYTIDGALPDATSAIVEEPLCSETILHQVPDIELKNTSRKWKRPYKEKKEAFTLRAAIFKGNKRLSPYQTQTYFFREPSGLPLVALSTHTENLFGHARGIYHAGNTEWSNANFRASKQKWDIEWWDAAANYHQRGKRWEREVRFEYYNPNGRKIWSSDAGVRINGNATRAFPQKSIRLYARNKYGSPSFHLPLFKNDAQRNFTEFILRNSGNDWGHTLFRDALAQLMLEGSHLICQRFQPVELYLNGVYWGIHNIRDRFSDDYFLARFGLEEKAFSVLEKNGIYENGDAEQAAEWKALMHFVKKNDLNDPVAYSRVTEAIDIASFTDFVLAETFFANTDWPNNNVRYFRLADSVRVPGLPSGKWYWMIFDMDYGLGYTSPTAFYTDMFRHLEASGSHVSQLFKALSAVPEYRKFLGSRADNMLQQQFDPERAERIIQQLEKQLDGAIGRHLARWRKPVTREEWKQNIAILRRFVRQRPEQFKQHLKAFLHRKG